LAYGHGKWVATMCAEKFSGTDYDIVFFSGIPDADIDQTSIDFGSVYINSTSSNSDLVLTNNGLEVMMITSITITGTDSTDFAFAMAPDTSDLGVGEQRTIFLQFAPDSTAGAKNASLEIIGSAPNDPTLTVSLSGTAVIPVSFDCWVLF
jgi:Cep192 domain 4